MLLVAEGGPGHLSLVDTVSHSFGSVEAIHLRAVPSMGHSGTSLSISEINLSLSHKDPAIQNVLHGPAAGASPGAVLDSQTPPCTP